jgi:lysosomal alpha-mannosidase
VHYQVGPIPIDDFKGKEVIARFTSQMESQGLSYTDANGRSMRQRQRNFRPTWPLNVTEPVSMNYFPVNTATFIQDSEVRFTVLTDRSQGGGSMVDGQLELMVHRRTLLDDQLGVGEPINEPGVDGRGVITKGCHRLVLCSIPNAPVVQRGQAMRLANPLRVALTRLGVSVADFVQNHAVTVSAIQAALPFNIHLQTFELMNTGEVLIRLAHQFETQEGEGAQPVTLDLAQLLPAKHASTFSVREVSLTANQDLDAVNRYIWLTDDRATLQEETLPAAGVRVLAITHDCLYIHFHVRSQRH